MNIIKSRLHLHPHQGPGTRGYIVADSATLRSLARHLDDAARGLAGLETVRCYGSDGHEYELVIVCDVSEEEWQTLPLPSDSNSDPSKLNIVKMFDELKRS